MKGDYGISACFAFTTYSYFSSQRNKKQQRTIQLKYFSIQPNNIIPVKWQGQEPAY